MDAKYWQEPQPKEPTALAFELPEKVKAAKREHQCTWEEAAHHVGLAHGMTASEVSTLCSRVRVWVAFQRRREARRMTESELAVFRSGLTWKPHTAAWRVFEGYMRDRIGDWPLICGTALGSTSAAFAALAGEDIGEYLELAQHCAKLCAELPDDWDPRPTERFPAGFPEDRRVVYRATPFRRYTN